VTDCLDNTDCHNNASMFEVSVVPEPVDNWTQLLLLRIDSVSYIMLMCDLLAISKFLFTVFFLNSAAGDDETDV